MAGDLCKFKDELGRRCVLDEGHMGYTHVTESSRSKRLAAEPRTVTQQDLQVLRDGLKWWREWPEFVPNPDRIDEAEEQTKAAWALIERLT